MKVWLVLHRLYTIENDFVDPYICKDEEVAKDVFENLKQQIRTRWAHLDDCGIVEPVVIPTDNSYCIYEDGNYEHNREQVVYREFDVIEGGDEW